MSNLARSTISILHMASSETKKPFLIKGLWPHEIAFLALVAWAFHWTGVQFRGSWQPLPIFGSALVAGLGVLIFRSREEWRLLPNRAWFLVLLAAWVTLFQLLGNATLGYGVPPSMFAWLLDAYTSPLADQEHALMMPFVVMVLFWWKRKELTAQPAGVWWPALLLVILGLLLHLAGFMAQQIRISIIGFFVGLYGLTGLLWGKHWLKASFFPFFLFAFCLPITDVLDHLTAPLRLLVARIVEIIAHLGLAPDLVRQGTQLMDSQRTFAYEVAAACSGIRSLLTLLVLATVYGFVTFRSPWKRGVLMASALPLAVLGNIIRLCVTIGVAEMFGQDAGKAVETNFGFITFAVALGCLFLIARWLEGSAPAAPSTTPNPPAV